MHCPRSCSMQLIEAGGVTVSDSATAHTVTHSHTQPHNPTPPHTTQGPAHSTVHCADGPHRSVLSTCVNAQTLRSVTSPPRSAVSHPLNRSSCGGHRTITMWWNWKGMRLLAIEAAHDGSRVSPRSSHTHASSASVQRLRQWQAVRGGCMRGVWAGAAAPPMPHVPCSRTTLGSFRSLWSIPFFTRRTVRWRTAFRASDCSRHGRTAAVTFLSHSPYTPTPSPRHILPHSHPSPALPSPSPPSPSHPSAPLPPHTFPPSP